MRPRSWSTACNVSDVACMRSFSPWALAPSSSQWLTLQAHCWGSGSNPTSGTFLEMVTFALLFILNKLFGLLLVSTGVPGLDPVSLCVLGLLVTVITQSHRVLSILACEFVEIYNFQKIYLELILNSPDICNIMQWKKIDPWIFGIVVVLTFA